MPIPDRVLNKEKRENILASNVVAADGKHVNDKVWSPADLTFIRTAAEQPEVERVLVNAAIKKNSVAWRARMTDRGCPRCVPGMAMMTTSMCA
jgi:murein endopeptidase